MNRSSGRAPRLCPLLSHLWYSPLKGQGTALDLEVTASCRAVMHLKERSSLGIPITITQLWAGGHAYIICTIKIPDDFSCHFWNFRLISGRCS
jgi:hypothetical protein